MHPKSSHRGLLTRPLTGIRTGSHTGIRTGAGTGTHAGARTRIHAGVASRTTPAGFLARALILLMAILATGLLGGSPLVGGAAAETGKLKLMVTDCAGTTYDNALIEVEVVRAGSGVVASDSDYTNDGYVEFVFTVLQHGDEAHVTVAACGSSETAHVYVWISENGGDRPPMWDIGTTIPNAPCQDGWWDEEENIIQCRCD